MKESCGVDNEQFDTGLPVSIKFSENEDLGKPVTLFVLLDQIPHLLKLM